MKGIKKRMKKKLEIVDRVDVFGFDYGSHYQN